MKKRIFLLVTVSAILIPSASTECEQGELDARYECCAETDASIEDIVLIAPDTEYERNQCGWMQRIHGLPRNTRSIVRRLDNSIISVRSFSWQ